MAQRLALTLAVLPFVSGAFAQPVPPSPVPVPPVPVERSKPDDRRDGGRWGGKDDGDRERGGGGFEKFRKKLEEMSPEERKRFRDNWERWEKMGDRERDEFRQQATEEGERIRRSIDEAMTKLGLTLDPDQREVFALRYRQERRKIEEGLREEVEKLRAARVDEALQRLKAEFSPGRPSPTGTPAPSPEPTP